MRFINVIVALSLVGCAATTPVSPYPHQWHGDTPSYVGRDGIDSNVIPSEAVAQLTLQTETLEGWLMAPRDRTGPDLIVLRYALDEEDACFAFIKRMPRIDESAHRLAQQAQDDLKQEGFQFTDITDDPETGRSEFRSRNLKEKVYGYSYTAVQGDVREYGYSVTVVCPTYRDRSQEFAKELVGLTSLVYRIG